MQIEMNLIEAVQSTRIENVEDLVRSIESLGGLIHPVVVKPTSIGTYKLISGRRRFKAYEKLNYKAIPATITTLDDLRLELLAIDENLERVPLNSVAFEEALVRRKEIYLELFPMTRQHITGGFHSQGKEIPKGFTSDVAAKLSVTQRTVERAILRASLSPMVKDARLKGKINTAKADILVSLPSEMQEKILPVAEKHTASTLKRLVDKIKNGAEISDIDTKPKFVQITADIERMASRLLTYLATAEKHEVVLDDIGAITALKKVSRAIPKVLPVKKRLEDQHSVLQQAA